MLADKAEGKQPIRVPTALLQVPRAAAVAAVNPAARAGALRRCDDTLTLRSVESVRRGACQIIGGTAIAVVSVTNSRYHLLGGSTDFCKPEQQECR